MRFGIPLLGQRVAPRCTIADSVLLVTLKGRRILERSVLPLEDASWVDVARLLADAGVDTLVCGGISRATRESVLAQAVEVIDNVAGTADEVVGALREGGLRSGFGLAAEKMPPRAERDECAAADARAAQGTSGSAAATEAPASIDCLACSDRACVGSRPCPLLAIAAPPACEESERTLEAAWDVACEDERRLCRLAELVYFALEMGYKRLGVAFCTDLEEPASILTGVLRRFFDVVPVCCKVPRPRGAEDGRGAAERERRRSSAAGEVPACDPAFQAQVLNAARTDLNVLVGLCVGADGVLAKHSRAPVTTIFVKDKSLANNPIGAVYSHYHLKEI